MSNFFLFVVYNFETNFENEIFLCRTVNKLPRRGYMGHLIKISNNIVQQAEKGPLGALIKETVDSETLNSWEEFVKTKLSEINVTYKTCLGGVHPAQSSNDDNSAEGKDVSFNLDTNLQEVKNFLLYFYRVRDEIYENF